MKQVGQLLHGELVIGVDNSLNERTRLAMSPYDAYIQEVISMMILVNSGDYFYEAN